MILKWIIEHAGWLTKEAQSQCDIASVTLPMHIIDSSIKRTLTKWMQFNGISQSLCLSQAMFVDRKKNRFYLNTHAHVFVDYYTVHSPFCYRLCVQCQSEGNTSYIPSIVENASHHFSACVSIFHSIDGTKNWLLKIFKVNWITFILTKFFLFISF